MNGILVAALMGAVGGAIGGAIAWGIEKVLKKPAAWTKLIPVITVVVAVQGALAINRGDPVEAQLDKVAPFKAMHEHYPDDYAKAVAGINAAKVKDQAAVTAAARPVLSAIVSRQIKKVDEANMMRLMALAVREGSALRDAKPASCVSLFTGAASTEDYSKSMPQALVQEDLETSAAILTQTATKPAGPATPIDPKVMGDLSVKVLGMLPEDERTAILPLLSASKPPSSEVEMRGMCDFYIALFSTALSEPEPGKTLRAMVAAGA